MNQFVGAAGQVDRLLRLVPLLHQGEELQVKQAAELLGVTPRQVVKDLKVLLMCGLPGGYPDDLIDVDLDALEGPHADGVIRVSNADYLARPVRLAPVEAAALAVALRSLGAVDEASQDVVTRTLAKLDLASHGPAPTFALAGAPDLRSAWSGALSEAIRADRQVRLEYWVATRDEVTSRVVDPLRIVSEDGIDYLHAWCHRAQEPRSFRLDRVIGMSLLESQRVQTSHEEQERSEPVLVSIVLAQPANWFPRYYRVDEATELPDGSVLCQVRVWDQLWLERVLLRLAPHVVSVHPPELGTRLAQRAKETLGLYPPGEVGASALD